MFDWWIVFVTVFPACNHIAFLSTKHALYGLHWLYHSSQTHKLKDWPQQYCRYKVSPFDKNSTADSITDVKSVHAGVCL